MSTDRITTDWLAAFLQANDPLFPTGAYAHSFGLEEVVRLGLVHDEATLLTFLQMQLTPMLQNLELPFVRYAFHATTNGNLDLLCELNTEMSALKLCRESREASIGLGARRLQTACKIFPQPLVLQFAEKTSAPHHLIVYGLQMATSGAPLHAALSGYFYQTLAGSCSAALKLIRIGQDGIQRALRMGLRDAEKVITASLEIQHEKAGWFNPLLEIATMRHERADERLFIS